MKQRMKALKAMTYATRRLRAGDEFDAPRRDARILAAIGRADYAQAAAAAAPVEPVDPLADARAEYQAKIGKRPFHGWDIATIKAKMAEADES